MTTLWPNRSEVLRDGTFTSRGIWAVAAKHSWAGSGGRPACGRLFECVSGRAVLGNSCRDKAHGLRPGSAVPRTLHFSHYLLGAGFLTRLPLHPVGTYPDVSAGPECASFPREPRDPESGRSRRQTEIHFSPSRPISFPATFLKVSSPRFHLHLPPGIAASAYPRGFLSAASVSALVAILRPASTRFNYTPRQSPRPKRLAAI